MNFAPLREDDININLGLREKELVMTFNDLKSMSRMMQKQDRNNIYDIKSQKRLQCVLRNGYSYKFHERKQYKTNKGKEEVVVVETEKLVQNKVAAAELLKCKFLCELYDVVGTVSPRLGCNESIVQRQESTSSLNSTRQIYNEMFSERPSASDIDPPERILFII